MTSDQPARRGGWLGIARQVVTIAYPVLLILSSLHMTPPAIKILLLLAPLTVLLCFGVSRLTFTGLRRFLYLVVAVAAIAAGFWLNAMQHESLHWLILFQESGVLLVMAAVFGVTLFTGGDPLCTRFIRYAHENPSTELLLYSRRLTAVWALFFIGSAALSALLFFYLPMSAWAIYNSFGIPACAAALFVIENRCQRFLLPREDRRSLREVWQAVRAVQTRQSPARRA